MLFVLSNALGAVIAISILQKRRTTLIEAVFGWVGAVAIIYALAGAQLQFDEPQFYQPDPLPTPHSDQFVIQ